VANSKWSPLITSVVHGAVPVGVAIASSLNMLTALSPQIVPGNRTAVPEPKGR
jgi:hypothetical protein